MISQHISTNLIEIEKNRNYEISQRSLVDYTRTASNSVQRDKL